MSVTQSPSDRAVVGTLFAQYHQTHALAVRDELVSRHHRLVSFLAQKFAGRGEPLEDLCQVGMMGLVKAIERFDPHHGVQFSTFATPTIVGEIRRYLRDYGSAVKISRKIQELHLAIYKAVQEHVRVHGTAPTAAAIAARLNVGEDRVLEAQEALTAHHLVSLDAARNDSGMTVMSHLGTVDEGLATLERSMMVEEAVLVLTPRERRVIQGRFYEEKSQLKLASELKVSQMHVSRIERRALQKMRQELEFVSR